MNPRDQKHNSHNKVKVCHSPEYTIGSSKMVDNLPVKSITYVNAIEMAVGYKSYIFASIPGVILTLSDWKLLNNNWFYKWQVVIGNICNLSLNEKFFSIEAAIEYIKRLSSHSEIYITTDRSKYAQDLAYLIQTHITE